MNQKTESSVEKEIAQIENEIFAAIRDKDPKRVDRILADDFVYRNPLEGERSRGDFLATIESIPVKMLTVTSEDLKVNTYGEVAVVTGTQKATFQDPEGKEQLSATAFVDVFVKRQGKWKLVLAHGTDLIAEKEK